MPDGRNGAGRTNAEERDQRKHADQVALMITCPRGKAYTLAVPVDTAVWAVESAARSLAGVHNRHQVWPMGDGKPLADPDRPFGDCTAIGERLGPGEMHLADLRATVTTSGAAS